VRTELNHRSSSADTDTVRVTDIVEHVRRPGRYFLTLSDGRTFTVSVQLLADAGATRKGAVLDAAGAARLERESAVLRVMDKAVASLSRGRRTRRELEQRLRRTKPGIETPDKGTIAIALDRLTESGLLSDAAVARAEASSRLRRGDAPFRVRQILQQKGIEREAASHAVAQAVIEDVIDEDAQCLALAERRMRSLSKLAPMVARRRLVAYLVRRGYGTTSVRKAVAEHFGTR
jgi:regulatory protein